MCLAHATTLVCVQVWEGAQYTIRLSEAGDDSFEPSVFVLTVVPVPLCEVTVLCSESASVPVVLSGTEAGQEAGQRRAEAGRARSRRSHRYSVL